MVRRSNANLCLCFGYHPLAGPPASLKSSAPAIALSIEPVVDPLPYPPTVELPPESTKYVNLLI